MKEILITGSIGAAMLGLIFGGIVVVRAQAAVLSPTLEVSPAPQPKEGLALPGALRVPFTVVRLRAVGADITVDSITVQQTGKADDAVFDRILLLDETGEPIGEDLRLKESTALFTQVFVIPRGVTRTITVAGNMSSDLSGFEGQRPALTVTDIQASVTQRIQL